MVLAPHRCSFSEMSFCKRQHSAISDGKRCATLREAMQLTHMAPRSCIYCLLFTSCKSKVRIFTEDLYSDSAGSLLRPFLTFTRPYHPPAMFKLNWWTLKPPLLLHIPLTFLFRSSTTTESHKLQRSSSYPGSQAQGEPG